MTAPLPLAAVREILTRRKNQVDAWLASCLDTLPARKFLADAMKYSLLAGGKRLRPVLCLSSASLTGLTAEKILPFACALEMIHTYSLIHDDLPAMDDDDLRRGRPACHKAFDEATAILAGDALLTDAFEVMASCDIPAGQLLTAIREVALAAGSAGMVGGQMMDMEYTGKTGSCLETIQTLHALKTGAMFRAACVTGGLLAGACKRDIAALQAYGEAFGMAFQIMDDILDETADTTTLGKPNGSDASKGKNTYPSLAGLERSRIMMTMYAQNASDALACFSGPDAAFLRGLAIALTERAS